MNPDLFALRAFLCVADTLNFGRAATQLHVSASRLTRAIQALEREVGTRLLARTTHGTQLTLEGTEFRHSARRMVAEADWIGRRFGAHRRASSATFTVGCLAGSLYDALPDRIRAARLAHPRLQIRLVEVDESVLAQKVLEGALDMGFLYFPAPDANLTTRVVSRRSQWVAMSADHLLAGRDSLAIRDLAGHQMILPDEALAPRLHHWYRAMLEKGARQPLQFVGAHQIHVALGLCAAGEGLCVVAEHLKRVRADDLRYVPLRDAPKTELAAIWRDDSPVRQIAQFVARW